MPVPSSVAGRVNDLDTHEWTPSAFWGEEFGPATNLLAMVMSAMPATGHQGYFQRTEPDNADITIENIDTLRGSETPSAFDMSRRPAVMDLLGTNKQLVFSGGVGLLGLMFATCPAERVIENLLQEFPDAAELGIDADGIDFPELGEALYKAHNDWAIKVSKIDSRLRPVAVLDTTDVKSAMKEAERCVSEGVKTLLVPSGIAPDEKSPAHPDLDPFWRMFTEMDVPVCFHISGEFNLLSSMAWADAPPFQPNKTELSEIPLEPYRLSVAHFGIENFLSTMILGGVFERHPDLRVGAMEFSAYWVGPLVENLQMWTDQFAKRLSNLSLTPAEYFERNIRVTPFYWEHVDTYIERHGLESVYCYGSDLPHFEGGKDPAQGFADRLSRLGDDVVEKFFVTNGELIVP